MKTAAAWRLIRLNLRQDRKGALFSALGVAVGVGALVFFLALGLGVGGVLRERVFPMDARLVEVVPPSVSLGALFGGSRLDDATVERLRQLPGVTELYRKMNVRLPAVSRYEGDFFGSRLRMGFEVLAVGVDPGLLAGEVAPEVFQDPPEGAPLPAVVSTRLLEIYNKTFAPARRLPKLSSQMILGFSFPVEFNRSFVAATGPGPVIPARAEVVGASDRALLAGITVPLNTALRLNRQAGVDAETFTGVTLLAQDPSAVPRIVQEVKAMGLEMDDTERKLAQGAGAAVAVTTAALALLSVLICVLAAVNIAHALLASVRARAKELGVMRAVGASPADLRRLVLGEAALLGLVGGLTGTLGAWGLAWGVDLLAQRFLPEFPFQPETFFAFPPLVLGGGLLLGLFSALVGAFFPSQWAASVDPARTLAG